jgi:hypothetical protein
MRKIIWGLALLAALSVSSATRAEEAKRFSPFPDVWGVELPETEACSRDDLHYAGYKVLHFEEMNGDRTFIFSDILLDKDKTR